MRGKPKAWVDKPERKAPDADFLERRSQAAAYAMFGFDRADGRCSNCRDPLNRWGGPALGAASAGAGSEGFGFRYCQLCAPKILRRLGLLEPVAA